VKSRPLAGSFVRIFGGRQAPKPRHSSNLVDRSRAYRTNVTPRLLRRLARSQGHLGSCAFKLDCPGSRRCARRISALRLPARFNCFIARTIAVLDAARIFFFFHDPAGLFDYPLLFRDVRCPSEFARPKTAQQPTFPAFSRAKSGPRRHG